MKAKPFVKWAGGKRGVMKYLLENLPQNFNNYYEPFVGGGALLYEIYNRAKECYISDINVDLIYAYLTIKYDPEKLIKLLKKHQENHSEEYYYKIREMQRMIPHEERAARFIYLLKTCYNGLYRVNKKGEFNTPIGRYENPIICDEENINEVSMLLQNVGLKLQNFDEIEPKGNDFVYFDPPYHNTFASYSDIGFTEKDQIALRDFAIKLTERGVKVMLSNSPTVFIRKLYESEIFNKTIIEAPRSISRKGYERRSVNEFLITNYQRV